MRQLSVPWQAIVSPSSIYNIYPSFHLKIKTHMSSKSTSLGLETTRRLYPFGIMCLVFLLLP